MTVTWSKEQVAAFWLAWIHDLETTDAPQSAFALWRTKVTPDQPVGYCCLGRGCVVSAALGRGHWVDQTAASRTATFAFPDDSCDSQGFPQEFCKLIGMSTEFHVALTNANDWTLKTFREIAVMVRDYAIINHLIPEST